LEPAHIGQIEIALCFICRGVWLNADVLKKILKAQAGFFKNFDSQAVVFDKANVVEYFNTKTGPCPHCAATMGQKKFKRTLIDFCPHDHGIWLDAGELKNVIIHDLRIKYGIFWVLVFIFMFVISRGRMLRLASKSPTFGKGLTGGGGASGSF
jgi:Zn-finger nucleic acid-binding protein